MSGRFPQRDSILRPLINACVLGVLFAWYAMSEEFYYNSQAGYFDPETGTIDFSHMIMAAFYFFGAYVLIFAIIEIAVFLLLRVLRGYRRQPTVRAYAGKLFVPPLVDAAILGSIQFAIFASRVVNAPLSALVLSAFVALVIFIVEAAVLFGLKRIRIVHYG